MNFHKVWFVYFFPDSFMIDFLKAASFSFNFHQAAVIEAGKQRELRILAYEAAREVERLAAETKAKELAAAASASGMESKDGDIDSRSSHDTLASPTKGR